MSYTGASTRLGFVMLLRMVLRLVVLALIIGATAEIISGIHVTGGFFTWLWLALLFSLVNLILGPILRIISIPLIILTLGLFLLVVNAALLGLTALLSSHLSIDNFWSALLGGLLISVFSWLAELILPLSGRRSQWKATHSAGDKPQQMA
jgi:putative membrane protein